MEKTVSINDQLLADALNVSGLEAVDDVVHLGLRLLVRARLLKQGKIRNYRGAFSWDAESLTPYEPREVIRAVQ